MRKSLAYTVLFWLLIVDLASAGDYVLVVGKAFEVCEVYLKNLNSFPDHPPMVCDRPLSPTVLELTMPEWQPLSVAEHLDLLRHVEQTLRGMTDAQFEAQKEQWAEKVKERVSKGWLSLSTSELDVDRDGSAEMVLRYVNDPGGCDPKSESMFANPGGIPYHFVLTCEQRGINEQNTKLAFPGYGGRPDVFIYKGKWYLTTWAGNLKFQGGQLDVHTVESVPRRPCEFKYTGQAKRRQP